MDQDQQNAVHQKQGDTRKRYKGLDRVPVFTSNTTTFTDQRDYRFESGQQVSLTTVNGPVVLPYEGSAKHLEWIQKGSADGVNVGGAKLWRDPRTKQFYLLVSLAIDIPDPAPERCKGIKGAALGERRTVRKRACSSIANHADLSCTPIWPVPVMSR